MPGPQARATGRGAGAWAPACCAQIGAEAGAKGGPSRPRGRLCQGLIVLRLSSAGLLPALPISSCACALWRAVEPSSQGGKRAVRRRRSLRRSHCIIHVNITKVISLACPCLPPPRSYDRPLKPTKLKPLTLGAEGWLSGLPLWEAGLQPRSHACLFGRPRPGACGPVIAVWRLAFGCAARSVYAGCGG